MYVENVGTLAFTLFRTRELLDKAMWHFNGVGFEIDEAEISSTSGAPSAIGSCYTTWEAGISRFDSARMPRAQARAFKLVAAWRGLFDHNRARHVLLPRQQQLDVPAAHFLQFCNSLPHRVRASLTLRSARGRGPSRAYAVVSIRLVSPVVPTSSGLRCLENVYGACVGSWPQGAAASVGRTSKQAWFHRLPGKSARDYFFSSKRKQRKASPRSFWRCWRASCRRV